MPADLLPAVVQWIRDDERVPDRLSAVGVRVAGEQFLRLGVERRAASVAAYPGVGVGMTSVVAGVGVAPCLAAASALSIISA